jgi:hypothetical protein
VDEKQKLAVRILFVSLSLGVLGDTMLRGTPWGVNFALWVLMLGAFIATLGWRTRAFAGGGTTLLAPVLLFACAFPWRDSLTLNLLSVLALLVAFAVIILRAQGGAIVTAFHLDYVLGGFVAILNACFGGFRLLIGDLPWRRISSGTITARSLSVACGVFFSLPLLLVFGALLVAADAIFESIVSRILDFDFASLVMHAFLIAFFAWITAGYLRGMTLGTECDISARVRQQWFSLGIVEVGIPLGLLNLLFLSFVVIQFRYFFGGATSVILTPGLTYSEYARRGFFELVTVSALVLPLLLFAHWILVKDNPRAERIFRWLAGFQLVLLAVIMASADQRMRLYQQEYGLTQQRLYPTAFMAWLAVVFVWFALTALRGQRERFAFGAMIAGFVLVAALHIANPDALIVRVNAARMAEGRKFDAYYASSLSADAVPELLAALPRIPQPDRCIVAGRLLNSWAQPEADDWRTWNYSRSQAQNLVRQNVVRLRPMACPESPTSH